MIVERTSAIKAQYGSGAIGFYNSGQLCLEEYYTLSVLAEIGLGTNHLDGNTRLCTSTAALALIESFGTAGAPGSYADLDSTDAIFQIGHNMPHTQTVLWARILDRRRGPKPPRLVVIDPRFSPAAAEAPADWAGKIYHATLKVGDFVMTGGDVPDKYVKPSGFAIVLGLDDPRDAERIFEALAQHGRITMALQETFWAARFGAVVDQFGLAWSVNCEKAVEPTLPQG